MNTRKAINSFQPSLKTPAYCFSTSTFRRRPIFRSDAIKQVVIDALNERRKFGGLMIFAYAVMPDQVHIITNSRRPPEEMIEQINADLSKCIIDHLTVNGFQSSLEKLESGSNAESRYRVFELRPRYFLLRSEDKMFQKIKEIHLEPVKAELADHPNDYLYSSARLWHGRPRDEEPFETDHRRINWRG